MFFRRMPRRLRCKRSSVARTRGRSRDYLRGYGDEVCDVRSDGWAGEMGCARFVFCIRIIKIALATHSHSSHYCRERARAFVDGALSITHCPHPSPTQLHTCTSSCPCSRLSTFTTRVHIVPLPLIPSVRIIEAHPVHTAAHTASPRHTHTTHSLPKHIPPKHSHTST